MHCSRLKKLGDLGVFVVADLTQLPTNDDSVDAAVSFDVFYHIAEELQSLAFRETSRVFRNGGAVAIVYRCAYSSISCRLDILFSWFGKFIPNDASSSGGGAADASNAPAL